MKLRVAIIGCGAISEFRHGPEYTANDHAEIVAFCDPLLQRAERLAGMFGGLALTRYEDALALPGVDAVSVCTANSTHAEVTIKALLAGRHVLCEKPLAATLPEARQMIRTAERCGKILMVGHNQRLAPAHVRAKELLQSGTLGRVLTFKTTFGHGGPESWSADKSNNTWFFKKSAASLGALGDLGVHKADLIRWLIDDEIDEVYAVAAALHKTYESGEPIDVEDNAVCVLKSHRGVTGTLTASWTYYGDEDNSTVLYCEKGIMKIYASKEQPLVVERRGGQKEVYEVGAMQTNDNQTSTGVINGFVGAILGTRAPFASGVDGYEGLSIALACSRSAKAGEAVRVDHYRGADNIMHIPQRAQHSFAAQILQMETNLIPMETSGRPGDRFCDDTYPDFPTRRQGRTAEGKWRQGLAMELGGRHSN